MGKSDTISMSESLESLTLVGPAEKFKHIYENDNKSFKNVKFLHYYDGTEMSYSAISVSFPNLAVLQILPHHLVAEDFLSLTKLEVYKTPHFNHGIVLKELFFLLLNMAN